ncbi:MAG: LapA family protein [Acidimicrobiales bacterium]
MSENKFESLESSGGVNFRLILGGIAAVALLLFIFQNTEDAEVSFLWWDGSIPLSVLLLITVALTVVRT